MKLLEENGKQRYTEFLEKNDRCNFQQSLEWGNVKTSWKKEVILSEDADGNIVGSLCVWIRKIPIFGNIMYSARGPVCDIHNEEVIKDLVKGSDELAKKYNAFVLRVEPDVLKSDDVFRDIISRNKFKIKDDSKDFKDEIQPRFVFKLDIKDKTEDEIFEAFHQKTRYNIRLATKKGVEIKEGTYDDLKTFHDIMVETGKRDDFLIRSLEYFQTMYKEMAPKHMKLLLAYHDGEAIANKCDIYDFRGVSGVVDENHPQYGLYRFKKGFNAEFTEFIGEVYIPYKPLTYKMYKISEKAFRTLRKAKKKLLSKEK